MTAQEFLELIVRGNTLEDVDLNLANQLTVAFPYFTIPRILAARIAAQAKNETAAEYIANAAIRVPNRKRLKNLVYEDWSFLPDLAVPTESTPISAEPASTPVDTEATPENPDEVTKVLPEALEIKPSEDSKPEEIIVSSPAVNRKDILKQLEENLLKIQKKDPEKDPNLENTPVSTEDKSEKNQPYSPENLIESIKQRKKKEIPNVKGREQIEIISQFAEKNIRLNPSARPLDSSQEVEDLSVTSTQINDSMVSEGFAKILVKQKKLQEAAEIYGKLQLKYPDKKAYFADCIKKLEIK